MDHASDEREYEDEILAEVVELEAESEEDYQRKLAEYKKQLEEWKLWRRKQVPARATLINQQIYDNKLLGNYAQLGLEIVSPLQSSSTRHIHKLFFSTERCSAQSESWSNRRDLFSDLLNRIISSSSHEE